MTEPSKAAMEVGMKALELEIKLGRGLCADEIAALIDEAVKGLLEAAQTGDEALEERPELQGFIDSWLPEKSK